MARYILLDTGVVGLLYSSTSLLEVAACRAWLDRQVASRAVVVIPAIVDYEARRELVRAQAVAKLARLEALRDDLVLADVTDRAWRLAAEFWAIVRQQGRPTADRHALDGDAILAAVAATIGSAGDAVMIATTNAGHLTRFPGIRATDWQSIS